MDVPTRLNVYLARSGLGSRRHVEGLVATGRVRVNGVVARGPGQRVGAGDVVEVDGRVVEIEPSRTAALYKPRGVVTTMADPQGRRCVADFLEASGPRLAPVGRLDRDSEGLLILTNDGRLAFRLTHPRHCVPKTYRVAVGGRVTKAALAQLHRGLRLPADDRPGRAPFRRRPDAGENRPVRFLRAAIVGRTSRATHLELVLTEGRRRVVRRALAALGLDVRRLVRTAVGGLSIDDLRLAPGRLVLLEARHIDRLFEPPPRGLTS